MVGWLVLSPRLGINLPGVPKLTKDYAVAYGILIGILLCKSNWIRRYRRSYFDFIILAFILSPAFSSLLNGLGPWDAGSEAYGRLIVWGVPYLAGRILVDSLDDVKQCALAVLLAGLIAVPLCLIEIRLSPQLHRWVYGFHVHRFHMNIRLGGYRPTLMFRHGIEVGTWLACSTIIAIWFALVSPRLKAFYLQARAHAAIMIAISILSRSLGSLILLFGATAVAVATRASRTKLILLVLTLMVPAYLTVRISGIWSPDFIVDLVETHADASRARSFEARQIQEVVLTEKAKQRLPFGWGGHNRFRVFDDFGQQTTVVDALWLIIFGKYGLFGLVSLYGLLCIPSIIIVWKTPARYLLHPNMAGVVALILALFIANADSLQNAFYSPLMMISAGVLATTAISLRDWLPKPGSQPQRPPPPPSPRGASHTPPPKE